ncbi:TauD/TfdA dioxygenase family protein [Zhongshania aquimaris]|uniref:TauD/TfdA family dioxygenase n=1 Tax=Zhongshania aquimaris TaxID=2857107 RepID=A0ABS6VXF5_9GAMM|nr:TauD/TfdA family dioxygenase [Zhongshania aquimaris]MBW2942713.1 TauD/TfdA family dioxygenase [Zhongshania aquimaris]
MSFSSTDLTPRIGTEIHSDITTLLSGKYASEIRDILERRGVVVFREINMSDAQQLAFTATLGNVVDEGDKGIYKVTLDTKENAQAEYLKGAFYWHIDGTTLNVPILASLLTAKRLSETGGDTEFCNTYTAYDDLSDEEKQEYHNYKVVHSLENAQLYVHPEPSYAEISGWRHVPSNTLPLVWKHKSGRNSLVLGSTAAYIEGMEYQAGRALLVKLRDYATNPKYVYRHQWKVGDLVIWDNTGTMHRATAYPLDSGRMMHRTKLAGEESFA